MTDKELSATLKRAIGSVRKGCEAADAQITKAVRGAKTRKQLLRANRVISALDRICPRRSLHKSLR